MFFVILGERATPLTPDAARRILTAEGLEYPWPFNACRHFWFTTILERGVPVESLELFLGHLREPLPWGPFGMGGLDRHAELMRRLGAEIVREVGFSAP